MACLFGGEVPQVFISRLSSRGGESPKETEIISDGTILSI